MASTKYYLFDLEQTSEPKTNFQKRKEEEEDYWLEMLFQ